MNKSINPAVAVIVVVIAIAVGVVCYKKFFASDGGRGASSQTNQAMMQGVREAAQRDAQQGGGSVRASEEAHRRGAAGNPGASPGAR